MRTIRVSNTLNPDSARHRYSVGPDLDLNCFLRLSVNDTSGYKRKMYNKPTDGAKLPMQTDNEQSGKRILETYYSLNLAIFVALLDQHMCGFPTG